MTFLDHAPEEQDAVPESLREAVLQLQSYFNKALRQFSLKLNPRGTDFEKKVWQMLLEIPYGHTISYQQLANKLGSPKAQRAVASANGKNPLWIVVPCHRVIGNDGHLRGYAGGLYRKEWFLKHEGAIQQQSLF